MIRLSNKELEKRLEGILNSYSGLWWKPNEKGRYPIKREENKHDRAALWIRITYGKEKFFVTTTGYVASDMKQFITQTVGRSGKEARPTHIDWKDVKLEDIKTILDNFSK